MIIIGDYHPPDSKERYIYIYIYIYTGVPIGYNLALTLH